MTGFGTSGLDTAWQRRPARFAAGSAALSVLGFVVMLGEGGAWTYAGFLCALLPNLLAAWGYLKQRRRGRGDG